MILTQTPSQIYMAPRDCAVILTLENIQETRCVIKINDSVVDEVMLSMSGDGIIPNQRVLTFALKTGDVIMGEADDEVNVKF